MRWGALGCGVWLFSLFFSTSINKKKFYQLYCTALDKTLGARPPDTVIAKSPWVVAPGVYLGKLFLVHIEGIMKAINW